VALRLKVLRSKQHVLANVKTNLAVHLAVNKYPALFKAGEPEGSEEETPTSVRHHYRCNLTL